MKRKSNKKTLKRILQSVNRSASYCCEASSVIDAKKLPKENAFNSAM